MVGRRLVATIFNDDSARDPENLSTFTAFGKIVDEDGTTILSLSPTTGGADGTFLLDEVIPSATTPGWYRWKGGVTDSAGDDDVRYSGPVYLRRSLNLALAANYITLGGNHITLGGNRITLSS